MNTKHTPTPWMAVPNGGDDPDPRAVLIGVDDQYGEFTMIAETRDAFGEVEGDQEANAAFMVRAVNAHDDMVAALKKAVQLGAIACDWHLEEVEIDSEIVNTHTLIDEFEAALAKAESQP